jgi:phosphoserine phosphatase
VRYADLIEVGRRVRLKRNIAPLIALLARGIDGCSFQFYVVSAAPQEVVQSALEGLVPPSHIFATRFTYDPSGEVDSIVRVAAGHGKVAELEAIRARAGVPGERVVYVGDGTSDIRAMLHVNRMNGLTIAVSPARQITQIAKRTVLSDDALSVAIPILEDVAGYDAEDIRGVFDRLGFVIQDWDKVRTDWLTIRELNDESLGAVAVVA